MGLRQRDRRAQLWGSFNGMQDVQIASPAGLRALAVAWREQAQECLSRSLAERMLQRAAELDDKADRLERRSPIT